MQNNVKIFQERECLLISIIRRFRNESNPNVWHLFTGRKLYNLDNPSQRLDPFIHCLTIYGSSMPWSVSVLVLTFKIAFWRVWFFVTSGSGPAGRPTVANRSRRAGPAGWAHSSGYRTGSGRPIARWQRWTTGPAGTANSESEPDFRLCRSAAGPGPLRPGRACQSR
jgi:hypothetical protein